MVYVALFEGHGALTLHDASKLCRWYHSVSSLSLHPNASHLKKSHSGMGYCICHHSRSEILLQKFGRTYCKKKCTNRFVEAMSLNHLHKVLYLFAFAGLGERRLLQLESITIKKFNDSQKSYLTLPNNSASAASDEVSSICSIDTPDISPTSTTGKEDYDSDILDIIHVCFNETYVLRFIFVGPCH